MASDCDNAASVESHETLGLLRDALHRFQAVASECIANIHQRSCQPLAEIEQMRSDQQRYVDSLESDCLDEDEGGGDSAELEVARERLAELEAAQQQAEQVRVELEASLSRYRILNGDLIPRATTFLGSKLDILNEKASISLDGSSSPGNPTTGLAEKGAEQPHLQGGAPEPGKSLENFQLPTGFQWVALSDIDLAKELAGVVSPSDFKKEDYATMQQGLEALRNQVLPLIDQSQEKGYWELNSMFRARDAASGIPFERGVQRVFEAFFCQGDAIYLTRTREQSKFEIINGRHRIRAALDAGWSAIPARTKDLRH